MTSGKRRPKHVAKVTTVSKSVKRKVDDADDDIYDGIKRLYNEDAVDQVVTAVALTKCGSQIRQDADATATSLHAVAI